MISGAIILRLLHTSDWHLGVSMNDASCEAEQRRFLDWLIDTLDEREIDVLVVAGDIFHFRQPSNSAQRIYYDFLRRAAELPNLQKVIVVAGNHDSPSGLESPRSILETLDVDVVGTVSRSEDVAERCLIPLQGPSGQVELVVCAVPYVRPAQLGVSGLVGSPEQVRLAFEQAFGELYTELADVAYDRYGEVRLVATGHLTCAGDESPDEDDLRGRSPIHSVGTIDALSSSIFDERFDYVALGHIHRAFPVEKPRVWYSGTPVPTSKNETSKRYVIDVDLSASTPDCEFVEVPRWRDIHCVEGSQEQVLEEFSTLTTECDLAPYVFVHVRDEDFNYDEPIATVLRTLAAELDEPRPRIVDYRETDLRSATATGGPPAQLDELTPEEVFLRLYESENENRSPTEELLRAFRELLTDDEVDERPAQTSGEPSDSVKEPA